MNAKQSEIIGTVFVLFAAYSISFGYLMQGFVFFLICNVFLIHMGFKLKLNWFLLSQFALVLSNINGIVRLLW